MRLASFFHGALASPAFFASPLSFCSSRPTGPSKMGPSGRPKISSLMPLLILISMYSRLMMRSPSSC
ncbi:MAG TPA: hypothetical protein DCM87_19100 [Planctomycetes bacterium]|nr:hypothetical protein [Planctomycetota bacterium]